MQAQQPQLDQRLAAARDAFALAAACHSLRGACAAVGANLLQERLLAIEFAVEHDPSLAGLKPAPQRSARRKLRA